MTFEEEKSSIYSAIELSKTFKNKSVIVKVNTFNIDELMKDLSDNGYTVYTNLICYIDKNMSSITITWE